MVYGMQYVHSVKMTILTNAQKNANILQPIKGIKFVQYKNNARINTYIYMYEYIHTYISMGVCKIGFT